MSEKLVLLLLLRRREIGEVRGEKWIDRGVGRRTRCVHGMSYDIRIQMRNRTSDVFDEGIPGDCRAFSVAVVVVGSVIRFDSRSVFTSIFHLSAFENRLIMRRCLCPSVL